MALARVEPQCEIPPLLFRILTSCRESGGGTMPGGQFDWGGYLLNSNEGAQRLPQCGRQSPGECKRISQLNCESDRTSRYESRG